MFKQEKAAIHNAAAKMDPLITLVTISLVLSAIALVLIAVHVSEH